MTSASLGWACAGIPSSQPALTPSEGLWGHIAGSRRTGVSGVYIKTPVPHPNPSAGRTEAGDLGRCVSPARVSAVTLPGSSRTEPGGKRRPICHLRRGEDTPQLFQPTPRQHAGPQPVRSDVEEDVLRREESFPPQVRNASTDSAAPDPTPPGRTRRPATDTPHRAGRTDTGFAGPVCTDHPEGSSL